jgi:hypothetical protein
MRPSANDPGRTTQLTEYLETLGCDEGWPLLFDPRATISVDRKVFEKWYTVMLIAPKLLRKFSMIML